MTATVIPFPPRKVVPIRPELHELIAYLNSPLPDDLGAREHELDMRLIRLEAEVPDWRQYVSPHADPPDPEVA